MISRKQSGWTDRLHALLLGVLLLSSFSLCTLLLERQPTGYDALGYQVAGRNLSRGTVPAIEHPYNRKYGPYFSLSVFPTQSLQEPARLYLGYPPGFPLLLAIPQRLGLPDFMALPILSTMGVFFIYWLGRLLFERWTGLMGAAIVAFTPAYLQWGTSFWADLPGTCFVLGALAIYLVASQSKTRASQIALGSIAGVMIVVAVLIKYINVLVLIPLYAYAVYIQRKSAFRFVANWSLALVVVVGLIGVGLYNQAVYGSPFETAYSMSHNLYSFPTFSISYALGPSPAGGYSLIAAGKTLWQNFAWLLIVATLGLMKASRGAAILLGLMFLAFLGLISMFAWAPRDVSARYALPLFVPIGLCAARGCMSIPNWRLPWARWVFITVLLAAAVTISASVLDSWYRLEERNRASTAGASAAKELTSGSEPNAVFLAYYWNDPINYFGGRTTFFYRFINPSDLDFETTLTRIVADLLQSNVQVYYVEDRSPSFRDSLPILRRNFNMSLWRSTPLPVYEVSLRQ